MKKLTRASGKNLMLILYVDLIGEDGADYEGLTREFFSLYFNSKEDVMQGPP